MKSVVLLSGGIDSTTTLYYAIRKGYKPFCLTFDYGQRHRKEIESAKRIAHKTCLSGRQACPIEILKIKFPWKGSSLLDKAKKLPKGDARRTDIPSTYVPARNIIFLSHAASYAEAIGAKAIFIGANQIDYSNYPDCTHSFLKAFNRALTKGTRQGRKGPGISIEAPLVSKSKKDIIRMAHKMRVPFELTWSCYKGKEAPCGTCDSCLIRAEGFKGAGIKDPLTDG